MRPHGLAGRIFGVLMERTNRPAYERAASLIDLSSEGRFLEIGFGTGMLAEMMASRATAGLVAGVDPSPLMVETARRRLHHMGVRHELIEGTAENLPWPDASFDAAAALHSFQFWPDPVAALTEIRRVLRPGGRLILILRDHGRRQVDWLPNPWSRTPNEIEDALTLLARTGFSAGRVRPDAGTSAVIVAAAASDADQSAARRLI